MTNRQIDNRIKKLQELERQRKEIEQKENELKAEIKRDLESKDIEELQTGNFIVRWKTIISNSLISNSLDSKALKTAFPELCEQFTKPTKSKRFTIA